MLGTAIWANQVTHPGVDSGKWVFKPDQFVLEGPNKSEINGQLDKALKRTSLSPGEHANGSKYRDPTNRSEAWNSEFNILRDFPNVSLDQGVFATPYPTFALTRALDGFYFDLLEEYAERKRRSGAKDNAYDNDMNQTLGALFQRYVGEVLSKVVDGG